MISSLARRVAGGIRRRRLWADDDRVAIAVSGGADSVALALLLAELALSTPWRLAGLVHVNHGLRGAEADLDAAFCRNLAERLGLPIDVRVVDVAAARSRHRCSLEVAARQLRYAAFEAAAAGLGATVVVTGHTADDQAETVLLRLLGGAATRGVSAIRPRRGMYARPLLDCRRSVLRAYLTRRGEVFREDASNTDTSIPRNRLRHVLMPMVESDWPGGVDALARFAELASEDDRALTVLGAESGAVVRSERSGVELLQGALAQLPAAVARRVIRDAIEVAGGRPTFRDIVAVMRFVNAAVPTGALTLHRVSVERSRDRLTFRPGGVRPKTAPFEYPLSVPGCVVIEETGTVVSASFSRGADLPESCADAVVLQADSLALPLVVRQRLPGDRLRPLGAPGTRKLQDVLVDRKVPVAERDRVPVVTDLQGRIVWVAGVAMAEACRVTAPMAGMVTLNVEKKGNQ